MIDQATRNTRPVLRAAANLEDIFSLYKTSEMVEMIENHFEPIVYCNKIVKV
jgi:hypothetical protein